MPLRKIPVNVFLKTSGVVSPYLAVVLGIFCFRNAFIAVLLYHLILLICTISINRSESIKQLRTGFHKFFGPLICIGGILPGIIIYYFWPIARLNSVDLIEIMKSLELSNTSFLFFAVYSCLINPFLEESFWRGCFKPKTWFPDYIDGLFAGYHAIILLPVVKPLFVLLSFLALAFVSWFFRLLFRRTGGLLIPLITHIIADMAILFALWKIM